MLIQYVVVNQSAGGGRNILVVNKTLDMVMQTCQRDKQTHVMTEHMTVFIDLGVAIPGSYYRMTPWHHHVFSHPWCCPLVHSPLARPKTYYHHHYYHVLLSYRIPFIFA